MHCMHSMPDHPEAVGRPILDWLLLPGWGCSASAFGALAAALPDGFRIHAAAPGDPRAAIEAIARDSAARDSAGRGSGPGGRYGLCGWSLGALSALDWTARCAGGAQGPAALVLIGATPRFVAAPDWPCAMPAAAFADFAALVASSPQAAEQRLAALAGVGDRDGQAVVRALRSSLDSPTGAEGLAGLRERLQQGLDRLRTLDLRTAIPSLTLPVMLLHGAGDALVPVQAARWLAQTLPNVRLIEVPDGGHAFFVPRITVLVDAIIAASMDRVRP